jgi:2-oxoisovalerate dehydrogenase E1 component
MRDIRKKKICKTYQKRNQNLKSTKSKTKTGLTKTTFLTLYRNIVRARLMDQKMLIMLKQGKSYFHIGCSGHEAVQTAFAYALQPGYDWAYPYYRDLAFVLQYGVTPYEIFLNFLAREEDPSSGGRQMSNHYGNKKQRIVTQSSPTGTQFLQAVGCAMGARKEGKDEVVYVSSGEGTTAQGDFHEALNWASRDKLPVIFVIQNNKYAISVPVSEQLAGGSIYDIGAGYDGLNRFQVDGTNFINSYETALQAIELARTGKGACLIEAHTIRLLPHSSSDSHIKYRSQEELEQDRKNDPLPKFEDYLINENLTNADEIESIRKKIKEEIDGAAEAADAKNQPSPQSVMHYIFAASDKNEISEKKKNHIKGDKIVFVDAINHALKEEMARNDKVFLFGQDVADGKGGVFTATSGISTMFGEDRCFNAPLAESSIVGVAIGMAVRGLKPVVEIQFGDYIWTAMMQIRNELSTIRWRSNNHWSCPVVIRIPVGGYIHGGLCHSQNIEAIFSHIPGLKIVYPSQADDAKSLLKTAIRGDDPVLFLEHKGLYRQSYASAPEPDEDYLTPIGEGIIRREGQDATIVTYGALVQKSQEAARELSKDGYEVEIIDIRSIVPLDSDLILNSVKKTNKVLIAHEDSIFQGFGAEITAQISEFAFEYLDAPVQRLGGKDAPVGFSPILEENTLPQISDIVNKLRQLLKY